MDNEENSNEKSVKVAYQNKDISSKIFAEDFKDTYFKVFGLELPSIVRAEPTELPAIEVNSNAMDNLYYLADDTYAVVDFESVYSEENKVKYLGYVARLFKRVYNQCRKIPKLRVVIVYTADVEEGTTNPKLDMGDEKLVLTEAFLSKFDSEKIIRECNCKIVKGLNLTDEERLKLMICPMAVKGKAGKIGAIHQAIDVMSNISDDNLRMKLLTGMLAFCDKVIADEDVERIRREIKMTKWERLLYNETLEAVNKATNDKTYTIATNMLSDGMSPDKVSNYTGLDIAVVEELSRNLNKEQSKEAMPV